MISVNWCWKIRYREVKESGIPWWLLSSHKQISLFSCKSIKRSDTCSKYMIEWLNVHTICLYLCNFHISVCSTFYKHHFVDRCCVYFIVCDISTGGFYSIVFPSYFHVQMSWLFHWVSNCEVFLGAISFRKSRLKVLGESWMLPHCTWSVLCCNHTLYIGLTRGRTMCN